MSLREEIIKMLQSSEASMTAPEIAKALNVSKAEVNSLLYLMEKEIILKSDTTPPPFWSIKPLQEQITQILAEYGDEGRTAIELSEKLCVSKSAVNAILYQFEGSLFRKNDDKRPAWFNMHA